MHLHVFRLHLPHLSVPALLLSVLYVTAIGVALTHPGRPTLAGLVVLGGLAARWWVRSHRRAAASAGTTGVADVVLAPAPAPAATA